MTETSPERKKRVWSLQDLGENALSLLLAGALALAVWGVQQNAAAGDQTVRLEMQKELTSLREDIRRWEPDLAVLKERTKDIKAALETLAKP